MEVGTGTPKRLDDDFAQTNDAPAAALRQSADAAYMCSESADHENENCPRVSTRVFLGIARFANLLIRSTKHRDGEPP